MRVISIFAERNSLLYSVQFDADEKDSLSIAYDKLTDTEQLRLFFKQFNKDFESFYGRLIIDDVVQNTITDADNLFSILLELAEDCDNNSLNDLFKPLDDRETDKVSYDYQQLKAYGNKAPWIRVYVVRYGEPFVFTGGTIKLTKRMKDRQHTKVELYKLNLVRDYLIEKGEDGELGYIELKQDD